MPCRASVGAWRQWCQRDTCQYADEPICNRIEACVAAYRHVAVGYIETYIDVEWKVGVHPAEQFSGISCQGLRDAGNGDARLGLERCRYGRDGLEKGREQDGE